MSLTLNSKLGPYEIVSPLGAGGMGEVYRARDTRLDRDVAIKVLPEAFARDTERVARFQREAKVLASLNHPHIAAIYGFEEANGVRFLVLELVEGQTLAERLPSGPMPVDESLEVCKQIAEAVEAAHEQGVIHRDLKPGNVKITPDGLVKVLDFGLAKAFAADASTSNLANSPTITVEHTRPGVVLGTAAYMSPEQARGKPLDKRTDIWSFGCLLYECLTGRRPFEGDTASDVVARILERDPDYERLPANTPPTIRSLLRHCLEKDRKQRYRDIGDAVLELGAAIRTRAWSTTAMFAASRTFSRGRGWTMRPAHLLGLLLLGLLPALVTWYVARLSVPVSAPQAPKGRVTRVSVVVPDGIEADSIRISPDGHVLAAVGRVSPEEKDAAPTNMILIRPLDEFEFRKLPGTKGVRGFSFSPDGRWLAFVSPTTSQSDQLQLSKIPTDGSTPPLALTEYRKEWVSGNDNIQFAWATDGIWTVNQARDALVRVAADTGEVSEPIMVGGPKPEADFTPRSVAPDGVTILLYTSWYAEGAWNMGVALFDRKTRQARMITDRGSQGAVTTTGHVLFSRGTKLLAASFDPARDFSIGAPIAILDGLRTNNSWSDGSFSLSHDGTLAYAPGGRVGTQRQLAVVDLEGKIQTLNHEPRALEKSLSASSDGNQAAVVVTNSAGLYELWITDLAVPRLRRFAADSSADCFNALWSNDHQHLTYTLDGNSERDGLYRRSLAGSGEPELLVVSGPNVDLAALAWTPDDRHLIFQRTASGHTSLNLLTVEEGKVETTRESKPLLPESIQTSGADLSPDGKWLVYASDESARAELYLRAWGDDGTLGPAIPVTAGGGTRPQWSPDGKHIYYRHRQSMMVLDIAPEQAIPASNPRTLIDFADSVLADDDCAALPGGKILVMHKGPDETNVHHVNVVLNWFEELKAKAPTK